MKIIRTLIIALAALSLASCQQSPDHGSGRASLTVQLSAPRFSHRALIPSPQQLSIDHFTIEASGPNGQTAHVTTEAETVTLGNLAIGWWHLAVVGYNSDGTALVEGSATALLSSVTKTVTVELDTLVGSGSLDLTVRWEVDQVDSDAELLITLYDQSLADVGAGEPVMDLEWGRATLTANLPSGSYVAKMQLFSQGVAVSGATTAIRIIDGQVSSGDISLVIGDLSTTYTLVVVNKTGLPIEGSVSVTPENPEPGDAVTMTYTPISLPEGIEEGDLSIAWYCEGELVSEGSASYASTPASGTHRYDVIVSHPGLGSMGSTSLLFFMPLRTEGGH